jgi:hypothetical protein
MAQITAWECERTGQLFKEEGDYTKHTRKLDRQLALEQRASAQKEREIEALQSMYNKRTFGALENWIRKNFGLIRKFNRYSPLDRERSGNLVHIRFRDMRWGAQSCSHNAPLGKPTNWGNKDELPKTYMGWKGSVELYFDYPVSRDTDSLTAVGVCTGGGGGGGHPNKKYPHGFSLTYEVILWGEDFPKLVPGASDAAIFDQNSFGMRSLMSLKHDLMHFERSSAHDRVKRFGRYVEDIDLFRESNSLASNSLAYDDVWDSDPFERKINLAAKALSKDFPYYIDGYIVDQELRPLFEKMKRDGKIAFLGKLDRMPILTADPDPFVGWKLDGSLDGQTKIIDLRARAKKIKDTSA